ncbi:MAG TPA: hypothetical protein VEK79_22535 [Thermoanaerobaculia bacterium]|nr:hypothetical protein [Thermoanaerobaculia bacterium]
MTLENDLKRALRREAPAPGFANRVMERIARQQAPPHRPMWWRAAAASVTLAAILGGYATHKVVEHRRGEHAKEQVLMAMRIAGEKVAYAQQEVRAIGTSD